MNQLTICVVTKGRREYLQELLNSLDDLLQEPDVNILLVNNGSRPEISRELNTWIHERKNRTKILNYEVNSTSVTKYWSEIVSLVDSWIMFPGDDDIVKKSIIQSWRNQIQSDRSLVALAYSADMIDSSGKKIGKLNPSLLLSGDKPEQLARSLHEPPMIWPATIFNIQKVKDINCSSRLTFDWFLEVQLLLAGKVFATKDVGLEYRVHSKQESYSVPLRRKYFEALHWVNEIIEQDNFSEWLEALTPTDKLNFFSFVSGFKPIYSDPYFSKIITHSVLKQVMKKSDKDLVLMNKVFSIWAVNNAVVVSKGEIQNFIAFSAEGKAINLEGNINLLLSADSCAPIQTAGSFFQSRSASVQIHAGCLHDIREPKDLVIDCSEMPFREIAENVDTVSWRLTLYLEKFGKFEGVLTPGERNLIYLIRKMRLNGQSRFSNGLFKKGFSAITRLRRDAN